MRAHTREDPETRQIWTLHQANQNDWSEGNRKKRPRKVSPTARRVQLRLSESARVCPHVLYFFPPDKHFPCFTTPHLCGNSFLLYSRRSRALSLTTGLVVMMRCSHRHSLISISGRGTEALLPATIDPGPLSPPGLHLSCPSILPCSTPTWALGFTSL